MFGLGLGLMAKILGLGLKKFNILALVLQPKALALA